MNSPVNPPGALPDAPNQISPEALSMTTYHLAVGPMGVRSMHAIARSDERLPGSLLSAALVVCLPGPPTDAY
ncbi:hypothetical protein N7528_010100 [Penicillium herquei]|nr:hypothetical protein N7528_010100 [Penicillium herquei]